MPFDGSDVQVSSFPRRLMALSEDARERVLAQGRPLDKKILQDPNGMFAKAYYRQWLEVMETALQAEESALLGCACVGHHL